MFRFLPIALGLIAIVAGYPYASVLIYRMVGTHTVVMTEFDGMQRTLISGPSAPQPDWIPRFPRSSLVQASHWLPSPDRAVAGGQDILTNANPGDIKQFYIERLKGQGFDIRDVGFGELAPQTAAFLGIDGQLLGYRAVDDVTISIGIGTPSGLLLRPRIVKLHWQQWGAKGVEYRAKVFGPQVKP